MKGAVWSWAENEPNSSNGECVLVNGTNDGRLIILYLFYIFSIN